MELSTCPHNTFSYNQVKSNPYYLEFKESASHICVYTQKKLVNLQLGLFVITYIPKIHLVKRQCGLITSNLHNCIPILTDIMLCREFIQFLFVLWMLCSYQYLTDTSKVWLCLILSWTVLNRYKWTLKVWMLVQDYAWYQQSWLFDPALSATVCTFNFQTWIGLLFFLKMPILW